MFSHQEIFGKKAIVEFYRGYDPDISQIAIDRRINRLMQLAYIGRVQRGKYVLIDQQQNFTPQISEGLAQVYTAIKEAFPFIDVCVWNTAIYASLMQHIPQAHYQVIEVDRDSCESVFRWMVDEGCSVLLSPDQTFLEQYQHLLQKDTWVVQPLITDPPLIHIKELYTASLEKLLVDMFSKDAILGFLQGAERATVFQNAFDRFIINRSTLMRYARRRGLSPEVFDALQEINDPIIT